MTIKDDYIHFMIENNYIIDGFKSKPTLTYDLLEPVIDVMNYLSDHDLHVEGELDNDVVDCFQIGFSYLYSSIDNIKRILEENFDEELDELLEYDQNLYLYLRVDELDTLLNESDEILSRVLEQIHSTFEYRKKLDNNALELIEKEIERAQGQTNEQLTSDMFIDLADSLGLELI